MSCGNQSVYMHWESIDGVLRDGIGFMKELHSADTF